jgi:hypothetical protein
VAGYADDVSLCSSTRKGLQHLIDCFCAYCTENDLMVDLTKCEVDVFGGTSQTWSSRRSWTLRAPEGPPAPFPIPLAMAGKFKYNEARLHDDETICAAAGHRLGQMLTAWSGCKRRLHPSWPKCGDRLFDAVTAAAGT